MGKNIGKAILRLVLGVILAVVLLFIVLLLHQYRPDDIEIISSGKEGTKTVNVGDTIKVMTWNVGYAALDETADFFMDGGKMVSTATKNEVLNNIEAISEKITEVDSDVVFLQEVDIDSKRSHHINELKYLVEETKDYIDTFAFNFKVIYIPYPIPNMGRVNGGIATLQKFSLEESTRIQLYCPFNYIVRAFNLRRCLMVNRIPVENSDKELVMVNLHLEAYDSGEGKVRQAKQLKEFLEKEYAKGNYVIAGGDFNQIFSNVDTSAYKKMGDTWQPAIFEVEDFTNFKAVTDASAPTCRSLDKPYVNADKNNFQFYVIDGFLVSDNLEIADITNLDLGFKNTDHNPLVMNVKLK